jgi:hypothetical protein
MLRQGAIHIVVATLSIFPTIFAQDSSCLRRELVVSAMDSAGKPISGLQISDFQGEFRGKPVVVDSVLPDDRPHRIVILVDASGSMRGNPEADEWILALTFASHLVNAKLPVPTSYALMVFSNKILEQVDFSQGTNAVRDMIIQISQPAYVKKHVRGNTALFDAAYTGLRLLEHPTSADALYIISDGGDNSSKSSFENLKRALVSSGVHVYVSLFAASDPGRHSPEEITGLEQLSKLIRSAGGIILGPVGSRYSPLGKTDYTFNTIDRNKLDAALNQLYLDMLTNYRVEVEFLQPQDKWREWKLELAQPTRLKLKNIQLAYPHSLAPCELTAASK